MIGTTTFNCISFERYAYLFCQIKQLDLNWCIGRLFEQKNDAEECQYVFDIWQDTISDEVLRYMALPGIGLEQRKSVYLRTDERLPYFIECSAPRNNRSDRFWFLQNMKMEYMGVGYNDPFEYMIRSRAITQHTNCYLGRSKDDLFDAERARNDDEFWKQHLPNLDEKPWNVYHLAEPLFKEVDYSFIILNQYGNKIQYHR